MASGDEAQRRAALERFASNFNWEDVQPVIEDPEYAADVILSELTDDDILEEDREIFRLELIASAERENARREVRS